MITRLLTKEDTLTAKKLWGYAFETDEPFYSWYFEEVFKPENAIGIFHEDILISYLQLNPYTLHLNGSSFQTSYIVGVITSPEYRNKGLMKILLPKAIDEMNRRNHYVSILMPFDTTFYSRYGWELCYSQLQYNTHIDVIGHFANGEKSGNFSRIDLNKDFEDLNKIYKIFLKNHHGYVKRNKTNWDYILKDLIYYGGHACLLKDEENNPTGYILYFIKDGKFTAKEIAYTNIRAKKLIFSFIYSHKSQAMNAQWSTPYNDPTHLFLRDTIQPSPTNSVRIYPFMCGRIIHFKNALENSSFPKDMNFSFSIRIKDSYATWNDCSFVIKISKGKASVQKSNIDAIDVICDISTFTQLFFGTIDLHETIFLEKIIIHNPSLLKNLSKIFYCKNNYINEFF
ncbi:GNAT family N-acetyltransferase [Crassaminicella profunda]|uniref:GNAT family N-acetyltransferase n=1 Tax=Crassaminicella profunda TaxID=1286698 RepID=UPI001CA77106|nr:GNAT family N-acetyltransferase [Crassaminicella profunda]QZY55431.1 GNAT family N-acetyltransferase [Crassaminicella profunda]